MKLEIFECREPEMRNIRNKSELHPIENRLFTKMEINRLQNHQFDGIIRKRGDDMTIDDMKTYKRLRGYTNAQIAELSGVPLGTVQKIFSGETATPRYATLLALESIFKDMDKAPLETGMEADAVREAAVYNVPKRQGNYTIEDYYDLPEERRAELIDGVFYDMSSPTFVHQQIAGEVYLQISNFIRKNKGQCLPVISPIDVRLDCDDKTMVQPDVLILCDKGKIQKWGIMGAPDFVLEILSPSTKRKDCIKKLDKYMEAGVREYWIIDPSQKKLIIYWFEQEVYPVICGLDGEAEVGIYQGELKIDLRAVRGIIADYPEE